MNATQTPIEFVVARCRQLGWNIKVLEAAHGRPGVFLVSYTDEADSDFARRWHRAAINGNNGRVATFRSRSWRSS